jgi:hypothetical protein
MKAQNIFDLQDPHLWECRVIGYTAPSILWIELVGPEYKEILRILIPVIWYYSGPFRWKGANFCIEDDHLCVQLMQSLSPNSQMTPDYIREQFKLYTVASDENPAHQIQILASCFVELRKGDEVKHLAF